MNRLWKPLFAALGVLLGMAGCAPFWEEITSNERDWNYVFSYNKPNPLIVLRDSKDGVRRAEALSELHEPKQHGGSDQDQEAFLSILNKAATQEQEPLCRLAAIRSLGKYHDPRAARILEYVYSLPTVRPSDGGAWLPFTQENNYLIKKESLFALENTRDPQAHLKMIEVARGPGPDREKASLTDRQQTQDEKIIAIRALRNYHQPESAEALKYVLRKEKDVALRDRALQSLEEVTGNRWPTAYEAWQVEVVQPQPPGPGGINGLIQQVGGWFK
jgi:hypothetical protein